MTIPKSKDEASTMRSVAALILLFALTHYPAQAQKESLAAGKPSRVALGTTPWNPAALHGEPKVVYGVDDRIDVYQESDSDRVAWANSTCALVNAFQLTEMPDGRYALETFAYENFGFEACADEPFRNQPTAAFCTGFVVGSDLIATAGHCYFESDLSFTRFVFGFQMSDSTTAVTTFDDNQVYRGIEIVGRALDNSDGSDYAIIRVDRPITAPGATVFEVRRSGVIPLGTNVGVIGHPSGLPTKIAFGDGTIVQDNVDSTFFTSNIDTYGGNSGSPVINAETGVVEGILVRGAPDFEVDVFCFRSDVLPADMGQEEATKASLFAELIANSVGQLSLDRVAYRCEDAAQLELSDFDLAGAGAATVRAYSDNGDVEVLTLVETGENGLFSLSFPIVSNPSTPGDGVLDVTDNGAFVILYLDEDTGQGVGGSATVSARIDCVPPVLSDVAVAEVRGRTAIISFTTDEGCESLVRVGSDCDALSIEQMGPLATDHSVRVRGLTTLTEYAFDVVVTDLAGNETVAAQCAFFTTTDQKDFFAQFVEGESSEI